MNETIQEIAHQLFFDISKKEPTSIDVFFSEQQYFPKIHYEPRMTAYIPIPKQIEGMQTIQGCVFSNTNQSQHTIFSLFLASICHVAGHVRITDFKMYKEWMKNKNEKRAYKTFEYIEDIRVNALLEKEFPEYYSEIQKIEEFFNIIHEKNMSENTKLLSKKIFSEVFFKETNIQKEQLKEKILGTNIENKEKIIQIADIVYESSNILSDNTLPFADHYSRPKRIEKWNKNITINTKGIFFNFVERFGDTWFQQLKRRAKVKKKYGKFIDGLEFDKIDFAPENIGEYLRLRNATNLFLKKMSSQIKNTPNAMDDAVPEDMGLLQMQAAIQAVASQNNTIQIFEQDDSKRIEEEWAIVIDTSSSMRLKFEEMKKFAICLAEAANEVNSKNGKWGFFTFNNNFSIIKDHYEKYDQNSKSRIGGIEVNGLSFIGDAVKLCSRILENENIERRYIFLITDGQALGTYEADKKMEEAVESARQKGISIVAIGMPTGITKIFSVCVPYEGLRKTVAKFLNTYTMLINDNA